MIKVIRIIEYTYADKRKMYADMARWTYVAPGCRTMYVGCRTMYVGGAPFEEEEEGKDE